MLNNISLSSPFSHLFVLTSVVKRQCFDMFCFAERMWVLLKIWTHLHLLLKYIDIWQAENKKQAVMVSVRWHNIGNNTFSSAWEKQNWLFFKYSSGNSYSGALLNLSSKLLNILWAEFTERVSWATPLNWVVQHHSPIHRNWYYTGEACNGLCLAACFLLLLHHFAKEYVREMPGQCGRLTVLKTCSQYFNATLWPWPG